MVLLCIPLISDIEYLLVFCMLFCLFVLRKMSIQVLGPFYNLVVWGFFLPLSSTNLSIFPICFSSEIFLLNWHLWGLPTLFTALFSTKQSSTCLRDYFERGFP